MAGSGPILFTTSAEEQIEKGRLCDLDIYYDVYDHKVFNEDDGDSQYAEIYKSFVVENEDRNLKIIKRTFEMLEEERHVLVLVQHIEHGHMLKEMFMQNGLNPDDVMFIWGDTPDKIRTEAIQKFRKGAFKVMIGSTIFDAGVNIPLISGVVLAGAGNSDITLIQRIGRGTRNCDYQTVLGYLPKFIKDNNGVKKTRVYDIMDTNIKFFGKQARNRYYNASQEFGADRVHIVGGDKSLLKRQSKSAANLHKQVDQFSAQLAMLDEFTK
jgi:superfamily II DNA or RNA helicase